MRTVHTQCCVVGGGPAGMMAGLLLARAGVDVTILEKHADFLRDFRGDTIHASTLEILYELGMLEEFLRRPHQELREVGVRIDDLSATVADFTHLPTHCKFIALMPQWDFLDFLAQQGKQFPGFHLQRNAEVTDLINEGGRVVGVQAKTPDGPLEVRAALTLGADGRRSLVRAKAGLAVRDLGAPIDVLWLRLSRQPGDPDQTLGWVKGGRVLVALDRGDYWQCAYIIPKGGIGEIQARGLEAFRTELAVAAPFLWDRTAELTDWDQVKLLTVAVDRLRTWYLPGLLCIGDSAHAMSPVGGVGINLAIQDAVAAANLLAPALARGLVQESLLRRVQRRREPPARRTQSLQVLAHRRVLAPALSHKAPMKRLPFLLALLNRVPALRRLPGRIVGLGFRPEHVR